VHMYVLVDSDVELKMSLDQCLRSLRRSRITKILYLRWHIFKNIMGIYFEKLKFIGLGGLIIKKRQ